MAKAHSRHCGTTRMGAEHADCRRAKRSSGNDRTRSWRVSALAEVWSPTWLSCRAAWRCEAVLSSESGTHRQVLDQYLPDAAAGRRSRLRPKLPFASTSNLSSRKPDQRPLSNGLYKRRRAKIDVMSGTQTLLARPQRCDCRLSWADSGNAAGPPRSAPQQHGCSDRRTGLALRVQGRGLVEQPAVTGVRAVCRSLLPYIRRRGEARGYNDIISLSYPRG